MKNYSKNKYISIAGAGISGLVSSLVLKRNGYNPILYEKSTHCGKNRYGDYEGLETWNFNVNPIKKLQEIGIDTAFNYTPINSFNVHFQNKKKIIINSPENFFYMISRGDKKGDLDFELQRQVENEGIEIKFNTKINNYDADIIATGSINAKAFIRGIVFKSKLKNQIHLILGNKVAPSGYAYLIIIDGMGTLAVAYKKKDKKNKSIIKRLIDYTSNNIGIEISLYKEFSSFGSFNYNDSKMDSSGRLFIGEAGGFQDYLFGFGIQYAIESAVLAAESIINKKSFDKLWKRKLRSYMKVSHRNRFFFEHLNNKHLYSLCKLISNSENPVYLLRKRCSPGILDKILNFI